MSDIDKFLDGDAPSDIDSFLGPDEPEQPSPFRRVADIGVSALSGAVSVPEAAVGVADIVTQGRAGKVAEELGFRPKEARGIIESLYSPQQQEANRAVQEADGFFPTIGAALENPSTIAHAVIQSLPSMGAAGAAARGLRAAGIVGDAAIAAGAGEGLFGAGQTAEQVRQESPTGDLTPEQSALAAGSGALTGIIGRLSAGIAKKAGISDVDVMLAGGPAQATSKGVLRRVGEGALTEGVLEELPQSAQEQIAQNLATGKPWDEGVAQSAAMGMLAGGVMGGVGGGMFHATETPSATPAAETPPETPAVSEQGPISGLIPAVPSTIQAGAYDVTGGPDAEAARANADAIYAERDAEEARRTAAEQFIAQPKQLPAPPSYPALPPPIDPNDGPISRVASQAITTGAHHEMAAAAAVQDAEKGGKAKQDTLDTATRGTAYGDLPATPMLPDGYMGAVDTASRGAAYAPVLNPATNVANPATPTQEIPNGMPVQEPAAEAAPEVTEIDQAAHEAATGPQNERPEPTEAQASAGNYAKGHVKIHGLDISIENPSGSTRSGTDETGKPWSTTLANHYGYIRRTEGADGVQVDAFIGPNPESDRVFVVNQRKDDGSFDEHKVVLGASSLDEARQLYLANYAPGTGLKRIGPIAEMGVGEFKGWLKNGDTKQAVSSVSPVAEPPHALEAGQSKEAQVAALLTKHGLKSGDVFDLAGGNKIAARQEIASAILGRPATPGESGVQQLRASLHQFAGIKGAREAERSKAVMEWIGRQAKAPAPAPPPTPESVRQPWQMTRAEYRVAQNTPKVEAIKAAISAGKRIVLATNYKAVHLADPDHIRLTKSGDAQIPQGKKWVTLVGDQVDALAGQAGVKPVPFEDRQYHHAAVEEAFKAGKPVPESVLADYPSLREQSEGEPPQAEEPVAASDEAPASAPKVGDTVTVQPKTWHDGEPVKGWPDPQFMGTVTGLENIGGLTFANVKHDGGRKDRVLLDELSVVPQVTPAALAPAKPQGKTLAGDHLLQVIKRLGGLNPKYAQDVTGEKAHKANQVSFGLFRKGADGLDEMARKLAQEEGYTQINLDDPTDTGGVNQLSELIRRALSGEKVYDSESQEKLADIEKEKEYRDHIKGEARRLGVKAVFRPFADIETEVRAKQAEEEASPDIHDPADELSESVVAEGAHSAEQWSSMSEEDKEAELDDIFGENTRERTQPKSKSSAGKSAAEQAADSAQAGAEAVPAEDGSFLESYDEAELKQREEALAAEESVKQKADAAAEAAARKSIEQRDIKARSEVAANTFQLGQSAEDNLAGQGDVFSQPAKEPANPAPSAPEQAAPAQAERAPETPAKEPAKPESIDDFGDKIGGARKDTARPLGARTKAVASEDAEPGWRKRFKAVQRVYDGPETWKILDTRTEKYMRQDFRDMEFPSLDAAEQAIPLAAVAQKHRVIPVADGKHEIWRDVTDRKRVKVLDQQFDSRDDAMRHMVEHAVDIIETKTSFGEEILAKPERVTRKGAERRSAAATKEMFGETFGFRGVEFGKWNSQDERQEVMNHAYDGLLDLADVLGVQPKALSLSGDLALAFGARGQGLAGAKAHYERDYGVINLTKMTGAGSLAHEWFHAADHYFARQDTKAKSEKIKNERGNLVYPASSPSDDYASHGFGIGDRSRVRPEVRSAYKSLIDTMFRKAEQFVEDTQKAEKFVGRAREGLAQEFKGIRDSLSQQLNKEYFKRNNAPASAEQLAAFDVLADRLVAGQDLATAYRPNPGSAGVKVGARGWMLGRHTNDTLEAISAIYKAVRGRAGFSADKNGVLDRVAALMTKYLERTEMLRSAAAAETKTKAVPTSYAMEAKKIDQGRASDYWTTPHEMAARAFSAYVEDKIAEQGNRSDFLSFGADNNLLDYRLLNVRPFPEGAERIALNKAFDALFKALGTRETDKGAELYSQGTSLFSDAFLARQDDARQAVRDIIGKIAPKADLNIVNSLFGNIDGEQKMVAGSQLGSVINVALNYHAPESTAWHEALHFLQRAGVFSPMEWTILERKAQSEWVKQYGQTDAEEAIAMALEDIRDGKAQPNGALARVMEKVAQFFERVGNWLRGNGFQSADDVFAKVASGQVGAREAGEAIGEEKYAGGRAQTDTPEFRKWFGKSVVQSMDGQPAVVYHGTPADFSVFDKSKLGQTTGHHPTSGLGFFFAQNNGVANKFAGDGSVMPVYLSIKNPYRMGFTEAGQLLTEDMARAKREDLQKQGYDGIRIAQDGVWVAFGPTQIKSAIGNLGSFDSENPDIRFSRGRTLSQNATIEQRLRTTAADLFQSHKTFNSWWHKSVGTQYHKAQVDQDFKPVFDAGQNYLNDISRLATAAADFAPDLLPKLGSLQDLLRRGATKADARAIAAPIFQGTLTDEKTYSDEELRKQFRLTDPQIKYYREFRAAIEKSLSDLGTAEIARLARNQGVDEAIERAKLAPDVRHAADQIIGALNAQIAAAGGKDERKEGLAKDISAKAARVQQLIEQGYAPLMRFGQYTVDVTQADQQGKSERLYFGMFDGEREANAMAREMSAQYPIAHVKQGVLSRESYRLFQGVSPDTLELFADAVGASDSAMFQDYLKLAINNRSAMKRLIERKGIAGFTQDVPRVLATFLTSNARAASGSYHMGDMLDAANAIPLDKGDVKDEAVKLLQYLQNPREEAASLRGLLFVQYLGGSIASAMVNMSQPVTMTFPYLAQFGIGRATLAMQQAGRIASGLSAPTSDLADAMKRATDGGIIAPQEIHQLYAESIRGMGSNIYLRKGLRLWGSLFSLAEQLNRKLTFAAAFNMARGMTPEQLAQAGVDSAYAFAEKAVEETQGIYNRGNRPNWARSPVGATVFTFKQYSISYVEFLKRLPRRERVLALAILMVAAGAQGLPGADDLDDVIDTLAQFLGYDFNSKRAKRAFVTNILGQDIGEFVLHGFSALPGVPLDVQARMGMGNLLPGTALFKRSETDKTRDVTEFAGPAGGLAQSAMRAFEKAQAGDFAGAASQFAPLAIQNALKAMDMAQMGMYRDAKGRKVLDTDAYDAFIKGVGFQPAAVARESRRISEARQDIALARTVESGIAEKWAAGIFEKDPEQVQAALAELREWNEANPESRIAMQPGQIARRVREMGMSRQQRFIKSAPQEMRGSIAQDG